MVTSIKRTLTTLRSYELITRAGNMPILKCEVISCPSVATVEFQGKFYCTIHVLEVNAEYKAMTIKEAEEARLRSKNSDKK